MRNTVRFSLCLGLVLLTATAVAEERKSPLEGQPAVRHRWELRDGRFELGPSVSFSINRALRHVILAGIKLDYHINDWFSLAADLGYGISFDTGLTQELQDQCEGTCVGPASDPNRTDDVKAWEEHTKYFSNIQFAGDIRAVFTPISGKMGIFSKLFVGYDMYVFGGLGVANLSSDHPVDGVSSGFRLGPAFGFGFHLFFNKWFAMGVEIRDIVFSDNQSGGDQTRGISDKERAADYQIQITDEDTTFQNHWFAGLTFTFYLPAKVEMSR